MTTEKSTKTEAKTEASTPAQAANKTAAQPQNVQIKKINLPYLIGYIFLPILICAVSYLVCYLCFRHGGTGAVLTTMVPTILAILWWSIGGTLVFKKLATKNLEKRFTAEGYRRNQTFYGRGKTVVLDVEKGILGIAFFWNPCETFILPASRISNVCVDDGKRGSGIMEGSQRVSFLFTIDNSINVRVDTFVSNQRLTMKDARIMRGIDKAVHMVEVINEAKKNSK